ncbi:hypothetical protein FKM82_027994 [Ascaphus truei]
MGGSAAQRSRGFNLELSNLICFSWITLSIIGTGNPSFLCITELYRNLPALFKLGGKQK